MRRLSKVPELPPEAREQICLLEAAMQTFAFESSHVAVLYAGLAAGGEANEDRALELKTLLQATKAEHLASAKKLIEITSAQYHLATASYGAEAK